MAPIATPASRLQDHRPPRMRPGPDRGSRSPGSTRSRSRPRSSSPVRASRRISVSIWRSSARVRRLTPAPRGGVPEMSGGGIPFYLSLCIRNDFSGTVAFQRSRVQSSAPTRRLCPCSATSVAAARAPPDPLSPGASSASGGRAWRRGRWSLGAWSVRGRIRAPGVEASASSPARP